MTITNVTSETFSQQVLNSDVPVVVDFYAEWCHPCHQMAPVLNALSQEHEGRVRFTKVNIDEEPELARAYRISSIPAVLLFDSGAPTAWSLGPKPGYVLEKELGLARARNRRAGSGGVAAGDAEARQQRGVLTALKSWWGSQ
ncbi:MAG: thioredoxin [Actinomycetota bacterium]|nr:thioredoxin [Actinomycetota bacterium]